MKFRLPSPGFRAVLLPALVLVFVGGLAQHARTQNSEAVAIAQYRVALNEISAGRAQNARLLLETGQQSGEMAPESAALLAYLQEKSGQAAQARRTLEGVSNPTPFIASYLNHLGGAPTSIEMARTQTSARANTAVLESTDARISRLEQWLFQSVNRERSSRGLPVLGFDERLSSVSRAHSAEMRDKKYFAHESPTIALKEPLDRYVAGMGNTPRLVAENIYRAWGSRSSLNEEGVRAAHESLMKSPGHRANILLDGPTKMGVGITANATGDIWVTEMFARN